MTQEPHKSNIVLIVIAIIGVVGTIIGATITVIGNYSVEKLHQETELTRIALVSIATQGGATPMVLQSTVNAPTQPHPVTPTPDLTYTQLVVPTEIIPTSTPIPKLFADNFDAGINPTWAYMDGTNFGMTNGQLSSIGLFNAYVGNNDWTNYVVEFDVNNLQWSSYNFIIMIRRQSDSDYMGLQFKTINYCKLKWVKVTNGNETEIVNSETNVSNPPGECYGRSYKIEATGNTYKTFGNGQLLLTFTDDTFANGGVGLLSTSTHKDFVFSIDNFQIKSLP